MIDFGIPEEDRMLLASIDRMMERHFPPAVIRQHDERHQPPLHMVPIMADLGLFALPLPEEYGGLGRDWRTVSLVQERLAYRGDTGALLNTTMIFGGASLVHYGTPTQKAELLPKIARGKILFSLALTEPGAGSDAGGIITQARRTHDGGWRINGRKTWISNAGTADYLVTACRSEPGSTGSRGISMLLIPRDTPGITMTELAKVGHNCMPSWDIGFQDVDVPDTALMGAEGHGFRHLMATLHYGRAGQAAGAVGRGQAVVDLAVAHAKERQQFGQPIGKFQAIQHRIAQMQVRVDQARLMLYHLAWMIATKQECRRQAAATKYAATEMLSDVTDLGMRVMAGAGYAVESDMQRHWRDSRLLTFGEGTNDIQLNIIAKEMGL
jgi:alkylation response protein AidB-like acyl-CoA dehydrogenase